MDSLFVSFDSVFDVPSDSCRSLLDAIDSRSYSAIYAVLRKQQTPFPPKEAFELCQKALTNTLTLNAFRAILDHCPPLKRFLTAGSVDLLTSSGGLVELAVSLNREDILDLLLSQGGNVNRRRRGWISPLEAAMDYCNFQCVERLIREPELDTTLTPRLLTCLAFYQTGMTDLDFCVQAAAPRLLGDEGFLSDWDWRPMPDQLTVVHAARAGNWKLLETLCQRRQSIPMKDGREALRYFPADSLDPADDNIAACAGALNTLLNTCPQLLRELSTRQLLLRYYVTCRQQTAELLSPWVRQLRGRRISLEGFTTHAEKTLELLIPMLEQWREYLPDGPFPALNRRMDLELTDWFMADEQWNRLFQLCAITGPKPKDGQLSQLAEQAACKLPASVIEAQFRPGGLFAGENPAALIEFVQNNECPWANRAAILAHVKQEEDYEL